MAIAICLQYFKWKGNISPPNVEVLIQKNILPIRPGFLQESLEKDTYLVGKTYTIMD